MSLLISVEEDALMFECMYVCMYVCVGGRGVGGSPGRLRRGAPGNHLGPMDCWIMLQFGAPGPSVPLSLPSSSVC